MAWHLVARISIAQSVGVVVDDDQRGGRQRLDELPGGGVRKIVDHIRLRLPGNMGHGLGEGEGCRAGNGAIEVKSGLAIGPEHNFLLLGGVGGLGAAGEAPGGLG